jgi:hypothetical protein
MDGQHLEHFIRKYTSKPQMIRKLRGFFPSAEIHQRRVSINPVHFSKGGEKGF